MWPAWMVPPLLLGSCVGVLACLYLTVYGILHLVKPDTGRSRLYGLRFLSAGFLCLAPLAVTLVYSSQLPIAF